MSDISRFRSLGSRERALVAIGVLLDGRDTLEYLSFDRERRMALVRAAEDLIELGVELRIPLAGTLLRKALDEL